jgi:NADH-quinone oxidoreductase subunit J
VNEKQWLFIAATALGAAGLWLMLPGRRLQQRATGAVLGLAGLGLIASQVPGLGGIGSNTVFWILAVLTVGSGAATVTLRNPVYCAIWFAMSLLGTSGLLLLQGSQFLAVATIVVYAGAIVVTFLFVLMLAQPRGQADYDRVSWEALLSASAGAVLIGILTMTLAGVFFPPDGTTPLVVRQAAVPRGEEILTSRHVERLGTRLFTDHLIAVEAAGVLLLVALVGAVAISGRNSNPTRKRGTVP